MKKHYIFIIGAVVAVAVAIVLMQTYNAKTQAEAEQAQAIAAQQQAEKARTVNMEEILNGFLKSVAGAATDYKKQRKVMSDLVNPQNLSADAYVDENNAIMQTSVADLRTRAEAIMGIFRDTEAKVREGLQAYKPEESETIMESWRKMRDEQASLYLAFFASEADLLTAYSELMSFYHERKDTFDYDPSSAALIFRNPADKIQEQALRQKIDGMEQDQKKILNNSNPREVP